MSAMTAGEQFYRMVTVTVVEPDGGDGWLLEFDCGDMAHSAIRRPVGWRMYCLLCVNRMLHIDNTRADAEVVGRGGKATSATA